MASFLAHGHEYHLYTYGTLDYVPRGIVLRDASEILPESAVFRDREGGLATFADRFRLKLLHERGGWWVDTDFICLKPFHFDSEYVFSSENTQAGGSAVNNAIMKVPAGCPMCESAYRRSMEKNPDALEWGEIGPALLGAQLREFGLERFVATPEVFCPVPWFQFGEMFQPVDDLRFGPETYAIHLWNAIWRRTGYDPNAAYHADSLVERCKLAYLPYLRRARPSFAGGR